MDRYTKVILTVVALNLTLIVLNGALEKFVPEAWAQDLSVYSREPVGVYVIGGKLDYQTDMTTGPILQVCTDC